MDKLYEIYEKERDPFFKDISSQLSETELQEYHKKKISETQKWLIRAFHSEWLTRGRDFRKQVNVALLLLCVPYITSLSLDKLNLFDTTKQASSWLSYNVFSTRNRKGFLRVFSTKHTNVRKAYTLTAAARENLLRALPQEYIDTSLGTSDSSTKTNCHDAFCCHLYYCLLVDYAFPHFDWYTAPYFDDRLSFLENMEKNSKKSMFSPKNSTGLRPDALIKTLEHKAQYFFVEQDMCTEKPIRVQEKFTKYSKLLATIPWQEIPYVSIIFSIYTDTTDLSVLNAAEIRRIENTVSVSRVKKDCDDLQTYIETLSLTQEHLTVTDIMGKLLQNMQSAETKKSKNRFNRLYTILENFQFAHPEQHTLAELKEYMKQIQKEAKERKQKEKKEKEHLAFLSRRNGISNTVSEISELHPFFQKGLRFVQVETFSPEELRLVYLYQHRQEILEETLLPILKERFPLSNEHTISSSVNFGNGYMFFNYVLFKQNRTHMIFENISIDLSAKFRLKNFMQSVRTMPKDFLYIVLLVSEINDALNFNKTILEDGETVAMRYSDPDDIKSPLANIQVVYMCNKNIRKMPKFTPFVLDWNNNIFEL